VGALHFVGAPEKPAGTGEKETC